MTDIERPKSDTVIPCWSCKGPVSARALFCSTCSAVQPPGQIDHFARLGMGRAFAVDPVELDHQYFGFQRRLHPDRFATRSVKERALSQQQATALNEAYETLKEPLKRAAYLLRLAGRPADIEHSATVDDPSLLMEAMEMREALADAQGIDEVTALTAKADAEVSDCQRALAAAFAADDLDLAGSLTTRLKYLRRLADEACARKKRLTRPNA